MPLLEAPETTESADPSGTAGAITPGTGTLAGASMASVGTEVPSGRVPTLSEALEASALLLTRLAVHTPERSASGTRATALLRRVNGLLVMCVLSPLVAASKYGLPSRLSCINDSSRSRSRTNPPCDPHHRQRVVTASPPRSRPVSG